VHRFIDRRETDVYDAAVLQYGEALPEKPDYDLAYFVYEEALLLQTTLWDHDVVLVSLTSLALASADNQLKLQILTGCLRSQNVRWDNSVASIDTTSLMGYLYAREENYDEAPQNVSSK
jgi:hypothetical protein